jgi:cytochrome c biogenesis protein CcmG/thiol:disulfide interchange protein DsbE
VSIEETGRPSRRGALALLPLAALGAIVATSGVVLMQGGARRDLAAAGLLNKPVPPYTLASLDPAAAPVTPALFVGRPYLINVFASWCAPCRLEHPLLEALAIEGVAILGVAYKDTADRTRGFLAELGDPFAAVGQDPSGRYGLEIGVTGVPETFVVDAGGVIRLIHRGPLDETAMTGKIAPAVRSAG